MLEELLLPSTADVDRSLVSHLSDELHLVALRHCLFHVLLDPLSAERRENAPEPAAIGPAPKIHLLIGEVLAKL